MLEFTCDDTLDRRSTSPAARVSLVEGGSPSGLARGLSFLALATLVSACAPTLSSMTPAEVARPQHVQAEMGMDVSVPTNALNDLVSAGESLADSQAPLGTEDQRRLLRAGAALALNPPSVNAHVGVGVGIGHGAEVQGRLVSGGWRLGGRYQFLNAKDHGIDLSAGLGIGRTSWTIGTDTLEPILEFDDYTRWQVDVPILLGASGSWYRWWGGPRILVGSYSAGMTLSQSSEGTRYGVDLTGKSAYFGGQLGGALGYKHIFFAAELTVVRFSTDAKLRTHGAEAGDFTTSVSGAVVYPALGLMGDF